MLSGCFLTSGPVMHSVVSRDVSSGWPASCAGVLVLTNTVKDLSELLSCLMAQIGSLHTILCDNSQAMETGRASLTEEEILDAHYI